MYVYDLFYNNCLIHSDYSEFETEEEAREDAEAEIDLICEIDGVEYDKSLFYFIISELEDI